MQVYSTPGVDLEWNKCYSAVDPRLHVPDKEKKFTFAMHSHKISTPTGTPVPDEKVKELSSNVPVFVKWSK